MTARPLSSDAHISLDYAPYFAAFRPYSARFPLHSACFPRISEQKGATFRKQKNGVKQAESIYRGITDQNSSLS